MLCGVVYRKGRAGAIEGRALARVQEAGVPVMLEPPLSFQVESCLLLLMFVNVRNQCFKQNTLQGFSNLHFSVFIGFVNMDSKISVGLVSDFEEITKGL